MKVTKAIKDPRPCTPPQGGDQDLLASLEVVYPVTDNRSWLQS